MTPAVQRLRARQVSMSAESRQEVRRWHRRAPRALALRALRVVTTGFQVGSVCALLAYGGMDLWAFVTHPDTFRIPHIVIRGNTRVTSEELLTVARLAPSINAWAWPLPEVQRRIEGHPRVKQALVLRDFPGEMEVDITERQPVALLLGDPLLEIDADGVVLGAYERQRSPICPIISGHGLRLPKIGERIDSPAVQSALALIVGYSHVEASERVKLAEVALDKAGSPVAWLDPGVQVPCEMPMSELQWARLDAVLNDLRSRGTGLHRVAAIDLRFAHVVPVRLRTVATG